MAKTGAYKHWLKDLNRKLARILAWEQGNKNYFRQHMTDVKEYRVNEAKED